jgi:hypothetical protein
MAMEPDLLDLYDRASEWTAAKVPDAATKLGAATPCDEWDVRTLLNHMLDTQHYFVGAARGEDVSPPAPVPPELLSDDPVADFDRGRAETLRTFAAPGVIEKTGPSLGIAFSDQLLHGWDGGVTRACFSPPRLEQLVSVPATGTARPSASEGCHGRPIPRSGAPTAPACRRGPAAAPDGPGGLVARRRDRADRGARRAQLVRAALTGP